MSPGLPCWALPTRTQDRWQLSSRVAESTMVFPITGKCSQRPSPIWVVVPQSGNANRHAVVKDCLMAGAHVICPAPFTRTLAEADELVSLADRRGLKIAVANPMRVNPNVIKFLQMRHGLIGDLLEIRVYGKMEDNCGGEDLLLHGAPLFDLIRMFAGNPLWCVGNAFSSGRPSTSEDIYESAGGLWGPVVGESITAQICMESNVFVNFVSNPKMKWVTNGWGMEFIGSHRIMRLHAGDQPELSLLENPGPKPATAEERWQLWPEDQDPYHLEDLELAGPDVANRVVVFDWLNSVAEDRPPCCSAERAQKALEMVHGIWESAVTGERVYFPLQSREHPLEIPAEPLEKAS